MGKQAGKFTDLKAEAKEITMGREREERGKGEKERVCTGKRRKIESTRRPKCLDYIGRASVGRTAQPLTWKV